MVLAATKREQILIKQKLKSNPPQSFPMPIDHRTESMPGFPAAIITTPTNNTRVENSEFVKGTAHNTEGEQYYLWLVLYDYNANRHYPQDGPVAVSLSLIHISEPTRLGMISYAVFCLKKK